MQKKLPILFPEPKNLAERIGNIETALLVFKDDGVQCPGIFANGIKFLIFISNNGFRLTWSICFYLCQQLFEI